MQIFQNSIVVVIGNAAQNIIQFPQQAGQRVVFLQPVQSNGQIAYIQSSPQPKAENTPQVSDLIIYHFRSLRINKC